MTILSIRTAASLLLICVVAITACSGQEVAPPSVLEKTDTDAHINNHKESEPIEFGMPKGPSNPAIEFPPSPQSILIEDRGDVPVEKLKAELSAAGVSAEIVSSIGDGTDPIFQENRFGVRPPSDLMEVIKDFAGWKLYAQKGWFSKTAEKRRTPWRTAPLKIGCPYEEIEPDLYKVVHNIKLSHGDFKTLNVWQFPLTADDVLTGQVSFRQRDNRWTIDESVGIPADVMDVEKKIGILNSEIKRISMSLFGGYDNFVGYVPMNGRMEDGKYFFWERIYSHGISGDGGNNPLPVKIRPLNFEQLEETLRALKKKYKTGDALKQERS